MTGSSSSSRKEEKAMRLVDEEVEGGVDGVSVWDVEIGVYA